MSLGSNGVSEAFVISGGVPMNKETYRMKLAYWSGLIKEANSSEMGISKWCDMNQISRRKYYYWHKKVMHDTYELAVQSGLLSGTDTKSHGERKLPAIPEFAELKAPDTKMADECCMDSGIKINWNDFMITVNTKFSEEELLKVLRVMHHV